MALLFGKDGRGDRVCILSGSGSSLSEDGFSMQGDINMAGNKITNLPDPTSNSEPVTRSYADTHGSGSGTKGPKGDKGDPGQQGLKGDKGDKGDKGVLEDFQTQDSP